MGTWGYFQHPTEPELADWTERAIDDESLEEFVEREMSYEDAMGRWEEDGEGMGAWMVGEV